MLLLNIILPSLECIGMYAVSVYNTYYQKGRHNMGQLLLSFCS